MIHDLPVVWLQYSIAIVYNFETILTEVDGTGETGLEVCPGREATTEYAVGDEWTPCNPQQGAITVNIGDALMYWSDDKLKVQSHPFSVD